MRGFLLPRTIQPQLAHLNPYMLFYLVDEEGITVIRVLALDWVLTLNTQIFNVRHV